MILLPISHHHVMAHLQQSSLPHIVNSCALLCLSLPFSRQFSWMVFFLFLHHIMQFLRKKFYNIYLLIMWLDNLSQKLILNFVGDNFFFFFTLITS